MKINKTIFLAFCLVIANVSNVLSQAPPDPRPDPPGQETPLDTNLLILLAAGLIFGTVVIYKNKMKKASM
ncbi:hypothetical protein IRZ83_16280 [Flavobacterium sp. JLP]|uniref:hypothetical protein n=1 Tax=unclassified Flavobacterium TaxID=196869 RepID=UPI00049366C1|nr:MULTISPECIES: hypothetical protein [unclassified Flavobacterium]MBF4493722.1 hypothetical protein [Flavobacterium sp. MR2016-29]MBF4508235.1 hypothetical protein [Flavobacterium sp. JLP]